MGKSCSCSFVSIKCNESVSYVVCEKVLATISNRFLFFVYRYLLPFAVCGLSLSALYTVIASFPSFSRVYFAFAVYFAYLYPNCLYLGCALRPSTAFRPLLLSALACVVCCVVCLTLQSVDS